MSYGGHDSVAHAHILKCYNEAHHVTQYMKKSEKYDTQRKKLVLL